MENWFEEKSYHQQIAFKVKVKELLHEEQSKWQKIEVLETHALGKLLLLDGKTMVSELDEFVYHEVLGHIPNMINGEAKKALIVGGGDGGIVREMVRHPNLEQIDLVEIDERVVEVSKKYFPDCTSGLSDSRVNVHYKDGIKFIEDHKNEYDIVIIDSTDPEGFAEGLFSKNFYQKVYESLNETGIMMNQTENPFLDEYNIADIYTNMKSAFPIVSALTAPMIIYPGVFWTFGFASKKFNINDISEAKKEWLKNSSHKLKWYNPEWHLGSNQLANFVKEKLGVQ